VECPNILSYVRRQKHASGSVKPGDTSRRVGVEAVRERGGDPEEIREKLVDAIGAEFTTYYYYTNLRCFLAGEEDLKGDHGRRPA